MRSHVIQFECAGFKDRAEGNSRNGSLLSGLIVRCPDGCRAGAASAGGRSAFRYVQLLSPAWVSEPSVCSGSIRGRASEGTSPVSIRRNWLCSDAGACPSLVSEPRLDLLAVALQGLKLSVARRTRKRPFWQARYYDFNVFSEEKRLEKLGYMHWNPMKRGLVDRPEDWRWSSCRFYQTGERGRLTIDSLWRV
jgi:hypothetical protein